MDVGKVLQSLGLAEKEAKAYLSLLRLGESTATKIAEDAGIDRTLTYQVMSGLIGKGLVSYVIKNNVRWFSAASPQKLMENLKENEEELTRILPELEGLAGRGEEKTKVEVYRGEEGIKTVWREIIRTGSKYDVFGEEGRFQDVFPAFIKEFLRDVVKYGCHERILSKEGKRGKILLTENSKIRYLPDKYFSPTMTVVYGNKTVSFVWSKPYYAIVTQNNEVADSFRSYFEVLWKVAEK